MLQNIGGLTMSKFSIGSLNQLGDALENTGWTAEDVTKLKQFKNLAGIKDLVNGRAEITSTKWREENKVIYFIVTSDGTTGEQWIARLEKQGFKLNKWAKQMLHSKDFKPTTRVVYEVAILRGNLFNDGTRISQRIRWEASNRKLLTPNPEVACLIHEMFTAGEVEAMGLSCIATFHKPIQNSDGDLMLLSTNSKGGGCFLSSCYDFSYYSWDPNVGFVFEVSQNNI